MSRKKFIQSHGATCNNWQSSWSFVNEAEKFVIFGAWDTPIHKSRGESLIFAKDWQISPKGRRKPGYQQSLEHIRLVAEKQYRLLTFPLKRALTEGNEDEQGPWKIKNFVPQLTEKKLRHKGDAWYAIDDTTSSLMAEEISSPETFPEGGKVTVTINAYERNPAARDACIAHHGRTCSVCGFNFQKTYGSLGERFVHVHHIKPIHLMGERYEVNPITDLIPVCPNCHAMIHQKSPPLEIAQLRQLLKRT